MAVRSQLDIEINDAQFQRFYGQFQKYQQMLGQMPSQWQQQNQAAHGTSVSFEKMVAALLAQSEIMHGLGKEHERIAQASERHASTWKQISASAHSFASAIGSATRAMFRWGAVSGLLGFGGLWGIEHLAGGAAATRRTSLGLGTTFGGMQSFGLGFGRFVDPGAVLGGISAALADPSKRSSLYALGMGDRKGSTDEQAAEFLTRVRKLLQSVPENMLGPMIQAYKLEEQGIDIETARRLRNMREEEFQQAQRQYELDKKKFALSESEQKRLADLDNAFHEASMTIRTDFLRMIARLSPELTELSKAFTEAVSAFLGSDAIKEAITTLAHWMHELAAYLRTDDFKNDLEKFLGWMSDFFHALKAAGDWLIGFFGASGKPNTPMEHGIFGWKSPLQIQREQEWQTAHPGQPLPPGELPAGKPMPLWENPWFKRNFPFFYRKPWAPDQPQQFSPDLLPSPYPQIPEWHPNERLQRGPASPGGPNWGDPGMGPTAFRPTGNNFLSEHWADIMRASQVTGVDPRIIAAQAALESNWGRSAPGNNYFGVKGPGGTYMTQEFIPGRGMVSMPQSFAGYGSFTESAAGYAAFLLKNPRYRQLLQSQGIEQQLQELQKSGYATDPHYAEKLRQIIIQIQRSMGGEAPGRSPLPSGPARRGLPQLSRPTPVIEVRNMTGGNAFIASSQLAV